MEEALEHFASQCKFEAKYAGSHVNWWTEEKLGAVLRDAGFSTVYRSGHGQSVAPPMRDLWHFDLPRNIRSSLYMEAIK